MIHGLRLDPVYNAELGRWIDISCISWKPCPRDARAERALSRSRPIVFHDSFDGSFNPVFWSANTSSESTATQGFDGRLVLTANADARQTPDASFIGTGITSRCTIGGNYDVRVDYRLLEWADANGVHLNFTANSDGTVGRLNTNGDAYFAYFPPVGQGSPTTDTVGTLRLVRSRGTVLAFEEHAGRWILVGQASTQAKDTPVGLSISSNDAEFGHQEVQVAFDNFRVVRGRLVCP